MMRLIHDLCNGMSFTIGTILFAAVRLVDVELPGGLPAESWSAGSVVAPLAPRHGVPGNRPGQAPHHPVSDTV